MKKWTLILVILSTSVWAQIDTALALSFYPLHVGDMWQYRSRSGNYDEGTYNSGYRTEQISRDTIINGLRYFDYSRNGLVRIDTTEMMVYRYNPDSTAEFPFWDLALEPEETHPNGEDRFLYQEGPFAWVYPGPDSIYINYYSNGWTIINEELYEYYSGYGFYSLSGNSHGGWWWSKGLVASMIDSVQNGTFVGIESESILPEQLCLKLFPNPFNGSLSIKFKSEQEVQVTIYDIRGSLIWDQTKTPQSTGENTLRWSPPNKISSGVYLVRVANSNSVLTQKVLLVK